VYRVLKRFKEDDSIDRKPGSGKPVHLSPREIEKHAGISRSYVIRLVKKED